MTFLVLLNAAPRLGSRDQQHLVDAAHRIGQPVGVVVVGHTDRDPATAQAGGLGGVPDERGDLIGLEALQKLVDDGRSQLAGRAGNENHGSPSHSRAAQASTVTAHPLSPNGLFGTGDATAVRAAAARTQRSLRSNRSRGAGI